jgi:hypothetical protein
MMMSALSQALNAAQQYCYCIQSMMPAVQQQPVGQLALQWRIAQ